MKKLGCLCLLIGVLLLISSLLLPVCATPADDLSVSQGCHSIDASVPMLSNQSPIENVQAALLYERTTQTLMYSYNADTRVDPASIVKVMTALIAVENGKLSDVVTVKDSVLETVPSNAVSVDLQDGEQICVLSACFHGFHGRGECVDHGLVADFGLASFLNGFL